MYAPHKYAPERFVPAVPQLVVCGRAKELTSFSSGKEFLTDVVPLLAAQMRYPPGGDFWRAFSRLHSPDVIQHIEVMTVIPCTWTPSHPYCDSPLGHKSAEYEMADLAEADDERASQKLAALRAMDPEAQQWWPHMSRFHCNIYSSCMGREAGVDCKESPKMASDAMWSYYPVRTTDEEFARIKLYLASMLGAKYRMPTLSAPPGQGVLQIHANMLAPDLTLGRMAHPETEERAHAMRARLAELVAEERARSGQSAIPPRVHDRLVTRVLCEQLFDIRSDHMRSLPDSTVRDAVQVAARILLNFSRWKNGDHDALPPDCTHEHRQAVKCPTACASSDCRPVCAYAQKSMSCIELCANAFLFAGHVHGTFIRPANALPARLLYCLNRDGRCDARPEAVLYSTIRAFQESPKFDFDVYGVPGKPKVHGPGGVVAHASAPV
jgi:hypothetical protein